MYQDLEIINLLIIFLAEVKFLWNLDLIQQCQDQIQEDQDQELITLMLMQLDYLVEELKLEQDREMEWIILRICQALDNLIRVRAYFMISEELNLDLAKDMSLLKEEEKVLDQVNILFMIEMLAQLLLIPWKVDMIEEEEVKTQVLVNIILA